MKAILEDIKLQKGNASFYAYKFQIPFFEFKLHYHPEFELTYIIKGNGYRLVGNNYESFNDGDLVLLGSNLPHTWVGKSNSKQPFEAMVIQFSTSFVAPFLNFEESHSIKEMLVKSGRGLHFKDNLDEIKLQMNSLLMLNDMARILQLVSVLEQLSKKTANQLSSSSLPHIISKESEIRINKVCLYLQNHFSEKITLKQIASLIFLTESNFCKFFKKATGKTFSDYLNEIRINEATYMLLDSEKSINQIAYECGFETLSYFNRVFLKKKKMVPSKFRKSHIIEL